jgi:hypothetical protein
MKLAALALLFIAWSAAAANLDGRWAAEMAPGGKKATTAKSAAVTLDLKSQGSQLTGSVIASKGKHARPMAIQDGKIDGNRFTFATVQHVKKGDVKFTWQGTLNGEQISGTRNRDGAKRGVPFTAKRQG